MNESIMNESIRVVLSPSEVAEFKGLLDSKFAIAQAAQQITDHCAEQIKLQNIQIQDLYLAMKEKYDLDLKNDEWDFEPSTGDLVCVSRRYPR